MAKRNNNDDDTSSSDDDFFNESDGFGKKRPATNLLLWTKFLA